MASRREQQEYIDQLLKKYAGEPPTEKVRKKIYDELMWEKHMGRIAIPFQVVLDQGSIEVVLESKR